MSGIINNRIYFIVSLSLFLIFLLSLKVQGIEKSRKIKFTGGGGYGLFLTPLSKSSEYQTKIIRPAFSGKLVWEPEYRLSIGIESGYFFLYSTKFNPYSINEESMTYDLNMIPLFLSISMRIFNNFEISFATGWSSLIYIIKTFPENNIITKGHIYSMSNFSAGCSYYFPIRDNLKLGAEIKYLYIGKTDNIHLSALINLSYDLFTWKLLTEKKNSDKYSSSFHR